MWTSPFDSARDNLETKRQWLDLVTMRRQHPPKKMYSSLRSISATKSRKMKSLYLYCCKDTQKVVKTRHIAVHCNFSVDENNPHPPSPLTARRCLPLNQASSHQHRWPQPTRNGNTSLTWVASSQVMPQPA